MMKEDSKERVKKLADKLEQGVDEMFSSERYQQYLNTVSKFHNYSFNNCMLILMQRPGATQVAGYKTWQSLGRQVKKGEKSIQIFAPIQHKFKQHVIKDDGTEEDLEKFYNTYRTVPVFDISQTEGTELPQIAVEMKGDVAGYDEILEKISKAATVPVEIGKISTDALGYYSKSENRIVVKSGMSQAQTIKTTVHEVAHSIMHCENGSERNADRKTKEVEAESVAYIVCNAIGLDTSEYSFGYIADWSSNREKKELVSSMEAIRKTADYIPHRIESNTKVA